MLTLPLPWPLVPGGTVIHETLLVAVHVHCESDAFTLIVPLPPPAGTDTAAGSMVKAQDDPNWVMVCVWPFTEIVPVRASVLGLEGNE